MKALVLIGMILLAGCKGGSTGTTGGGGNIGPAGTDALTPCDPLESKTVPATLGTVLGAGRAPDGTIYVVDQTIDNPSAPRIFLSQGNALYLQHELGAGSDGDDWYIFTLDGNLQVRLERTGGVATKMGIFRGPPDSKTKSFEIGVQGDVLTLLTDADVRDLPAFDVQTAGIMVDATTPDGHRFFAVEGIDPTYTVRVFYGTDNDLRERKLLSNDSNSDILLELDLDGVKTNAVFITPFSGPYFGTSSHLQNETDGTSTPLTRVEGSPGYGQDTLQPPNPDGGLSLPPETPRKSNAELTAGLSFQCF